MLKRSQPDQENQKASKEIKEPKEQKIELILCPHCLRTATNGIKCQGICVADSGY